MKVKLQKNLRRQILRGHPWVYRDALVDAPMVDRAQLTQLLDPKNEHLAWAMYDPNGPLALRILSLEKKPPSHRTFENQLSKALRLRKSFLGEDTNCYRWINGEGDFMPGLIIDIYDSTAVIQTDGIGPHQFWDMTFLCDWILNNTECKSVIEKTRLGGEKETNQLAGVEYEKEIAVKENGIEFLVDLEKGQKTGFFLDQRDNRQYLRGLSKNQTTLNLFSYSGGFSIYAGMGNAQHVTSVDISKKATDLAQRNWELNALPMNQHESVSADVFEYLMTEKSNWDAVIVDPPSMAKSEKQKPQALGKYTELFAAAAKRVNASGSLYLSSCSSHISFSDFNEIISEALSKSRRRGQVLRISGQGPDHPFPHICHELRYLKFVHLILN